MQPEIVVDLLKRLLAGADLLRERRAAGDADPELALALELCSGRMVEAVDAIATLQQHEAAAD